MLAQNPIVHSNLKEATKTFQMHLNTFPKLLLFLLSLAENTKIELFLTF